MCESFRVISKGLNFRNNQLYGEWPTAVLSVYMFTHATFTLYIQITTFTTGGVFKALIHFSGDYNYVAPKVQFLTIPFHPNGEALHSVLLVRNNLL